MRVLFFTIVMLMASSSYAEIIDGTGTACSKVDSIPSNNSIKLVSERTILDTSRASVGEEHLLELASAARHFDLSLCVQIKDYKVERAYVK